MHTTCTMPFAMNKHLIIALNYSNHGHGYCRLQAKIALHCFIFCRLMLTRNTKGKYV